MARRKKSAPPPPQPTGGSAPQDRECRIPELAKVPPAALPHHATNTPQPAAALRVLVLSSSRLVRTRVASRLGEFDQAIECTHAATLDQARAAAAKSRCDLALIAFEPGALDLITEFSRTPARPACILLAEDPSLDLSVAAIRAGAIDLLSCRAAAAELHERLRSALLRTRLTRHREARIDRLTRVCRKLNDARHEVTQQVSSLCGDLVSAYQELADQVSDLGTASEFNSLIRQELDVESVLRTALEYILAQTGPTNAAVFLPGNGSDFSLGAYVNYDVPKDTLDMVLEHMASFIPPRMEAEYDLKVINSARELHQFFGEQAQWLGDSRAVAFACHHEGECLAVAILFRDQRTPFPDSVISSLRIIASLFGRQLARVIHVHHRHLPKDKWGGFADGDDDIDLAA